MSWFDGRLPKWPFGGGGAALAEIEAEPAGVEPGAGTPRLTILVSDASGFASFKSHTFTEAQTAAEFIQTWYGKRIDNGLIAFWAMTEQPDIRPEPGADAAVEAIVIVRDDLGDGVVYPFSFVEMSEAHSFIRFEMKRGVNPDLLQVYWAVPVQLGVTSDGTVRLYPETPPATTGEPYFEAPETARLEAPAANRQEEARHEMIEWSTATSEDDPIEAMLRKPRAPAVYRNGSAAAGEAIKAAEQQIEAMESAGVVDEVPMGAAAEAVAAEVEAGILDADSAPFDGGETGVELVQDGFVDESGWLEAEAAIEDSFGTEGDMYETVEDFGDVVIQEPSRPARQEVLAAEPARAPASVVLSEPAGTEFPAGRAFARSQGPQGDANDELQKVLKVRRWEERSSPFSGFDSPPGKF